MKSRTRIEQINALQEMERYGMKYEPVGDNEVRCLCPAHEDSSPSCCVNVEKNTWICHACKARGDIVKLLALHIGKEPAVVLADLAKRYDIAGIKTINPETVEKYHEKIWDSGPFLQELYKRGITDQMIRWARLGFSGNRIIIPIYDDHGNVINLRKYLPGAPTKTKMRNSQGYGKMSLYRPKDLQHEQVWVCGGELKALVVGSLLQEEGIGAVSASGGEGSWSEAFNGLFKDKIVYVCMDIDSAGRAAARSIASQLAPVALSVYLIFLPLDRKKHPKGDINDYIAEGHGKDDLIKLMQDAERYVPPALEEDEADKREPKRVRLVDAPSSENIGIPISVEATITAMDTTPYLVPKKVGVHCTMDQPNCSSCIVKGREQNEKGYVDLHVKGTSIGVLHVVEAPESRQREAIRTALRIPPCKVATFHVYEHYSVYDTRLAPQLTIGSNNSEHVVMPAMVVGKGLESNTPYVFKGRVHPSPKNQQAVLLLDSVEEAEDSLSSFTPSEDELEPLAVFKAEADTVESISRKLDHIYQDIEANVTRIFHRRDLHLALDLGFYSVLYIGFDGQQQKGWTNILVTGDSSQGKSEAMLRILAHYGVGERVECKNSTPAGLMGGVQQLGNRWFVSWGIIPQHDRRLVCLEEIKGTSTSVLGKLTDMRSSGVAEVTKIEKRRAHARTRLIMISNPRSDRAIGAFNFGIEAIKELIGGLEDIRRFDLAVILSAAQIDPKEINRLSTSRPLVKHTYSSDLCRQLVLWAWTRTPDQVFFEDDAVTACLQRATELCTTFNESLPLVDRGTMRYKLARLAAALAARLFSTTDDPQVLRVTSAHVDYIAQFIKRIYSDPTFGYADFSRAQEYTNKVIDPVLVEKHIRETKYPRDLVEHLLHADEIQPSDICDWCDVDRDDGQRLLSFLVRKHALYRVKRNYVKTSEFIQLLKTLRDRGDLVNRDEELDRKEPF